jgi:hypothetical protein
MSRSVARKDKELDVWGWRAGLVKTAVSVLRARDSHVRALPTPRCNAGVVCDESEGWRAAWGLSRTCDEIPDPEFDDPWMRQHFSCIVSELFLSFETRNQ